MVLSNPTQAVEAVRARSAVRERAQEARRKPNVMRASGMRIEPSSSSDALRAISGHRQGWQTHAFGYRDRIGELRYALQFRARAISRVRFHVAMIVDDDDEPVAVSLRNDTDPEKAGRITIDPTLCEAAEEELARLPLDSGYSFVGVWSENQDIAGEVWLHGYYDEFGEEVWRFRSVDEVDVSPDGRTVNLKDDLTGSPGRRVDLANEELYRLWVPHPRRAYLADSALCALLDVLEDIVLVGRELRAAARSRIMANGILKTPHGLSVMKNVREDTDDGADDTDGDAFMAELTAALMAPIQNEGDAGSVVPVIVRGDREDLEAFVHMPLVREDSERLLEKLSAALGRMANGLDIPPEILTGMADVNHWTAWQIDSSTARHHIEPSVRNMADSLTQAFLRPALRQYGFPLSDIKRIRVWYDLGSLTENPNRREDAITAREQGAIGDESFRQALGFNDGDAPSAAERLFMIASKAGMDQAAATTIMQWYADQQEGGSLDIPLPAPAALPVTAARPAAAPSPMPGPGQPPGSTPDSGPIPPPAQTASARPETAWSGADSLIIHSGTKEPDVPYLLATEQARQLMEVDRAVRTQIIAAAEAALTRALERAGSRMRAKATADRELSLTLKPVASLAVCAHIGRDRAFALGATEEHLLADAFDSLAGKFKTLVTLGISAVVDRVLKMLGLKRGDSGPGDKIAGRMERSMSGRINDGWQWLHAALLERARKRMFGEDQEEEPGELAEGDIPAYLVRGALALVGGLPETSGGLDEKGRSLSGQPVGGLANGDTVHHEIEQAGGVELGYLWVYGVTPQQRRFDPHWDLEGERFASWADPKLETTTKDGGRWAWVGDHFRPGDHTGCMCDYVPGWAIPQYGEQVRERLALPAQGMADILRLAEGDDAAGRKGTTAQHMRDQHNHIQGLQARFLKGAAA